MGRKLIYLDDAIDEIEMLLEQSEDDVLDTTWNNAIRGAINAVKHHVPSAQPSVSDCWGCNCPKMERSKEQKTFSEMVHLHDDETHEERTETHARDWVERQAAIDAVKRNTFRLTFAEEQNCEGHVAWSAEAVYSDVMEGELLELPSAQPSEEYEKGWKDGQEALREEMWEYGRDRLD